MVIDYSERRQMLRNKPKRPATWPYALLILFFIALSYVLGVGTGWYLYRPGGKLYKAPPAAAVPQARNEAPKQLPGGAPPPVTPLPQPPEGSNPAAAAPSGQAPATAVDKAAPVPLTFYNTLQKGNKGLMGTGLNPSKEGQGAPAKPSAPPARDH